MLTSNTFGRYIQLQRHRYNPSAQVSTGPLESSPTRHAGNLGVCPLRARSGHRSAYDFGWVTTAAPSGRQLLKNSALGFDREQQRNDSTDQRDR